VKLAVLGEPLHYTRSPELHRAGLEAVGIACESAAIRTPAAELGPRLEALAEAGFHGANLTHPHKEAVIAHLARVSEVSGRARSVNTVGFSREGAWGDTTDGAGFVDLLRWRRRDPSAERVVLLGAGGAARALALALSEAGCARIAISARGPAAARPPERAGVAATTVGWRSEEERAALADATLVVNATPIAGDAGPVPLGGVARGALLVDLVYGPEPTPWVRGARALGFDAEDGLGLLVFQARRSLALWTGREVPIDPLARAVGWPR
jgi:shikimate dehydrogenase